MDHSKSVVDIEAGPSVGTGEPINMRYEPTTDRPASDYPYTLKICALAREDPSNFHRYKTLAIKMRDELKITLPQNLKISDSTLDFVNLVNGFFSRRGYLICADETFVADVKKGTITNSALWDPDSGDGSWSQTLVYIPTDTDTRLIHVALSESKQTAFVPGDAPSIDFIPMIGGEVLINKNIITWASMPSAELIETLGFAYNIPPLFFTQMISTVEEHLITGECKRVELNREYKTTTNCDIGTLVLGFDSASSEDMAPRVWIYFLPKAVSNEDCPIIIVFSRPSGWPLHHTHDPNIQEDPHSLLKISEKIGGKEAADTDQNPIEILIPFLDSLTSFFRWKVSEMDDDHKKWLVLVRRLSTAEMSKFDHDLLQRWLVFRAFLEDFCLILDKIEDFFDDLETKKVVSERSTAPKMTRSIKVQQKLLARGRSLEAMVRDTIQLNIGGVALQESRRSIQQANSVGRISVLAFIFLPLSLVTSIFGMNISEVTGSGASWRAFFATSIIFGGLMVLLCSIIWRKSRVVRWILSVLRRLRRFSRRKFRALFEAFIVREPLVVKALLNWRHDPNRSKLQQRKIQWMILKYAAPARQGSGAGQAIDDAMILETVFGKVRDPQKLDAALRAYDKACRPRTQKIVESSKITGILICERGAEVG
ncbi:Magnesium transport protein CorA, transmembrane region [Glarea lozoyensis ATCC 20868]|uniref:Magnesium transport protein CorA, transmembrane region n=1 Tax=Glarea lozoyensis (strain ATCC 20868 / MF5171) TaxID=1116229 RepID=S3CY36_GLAL2|nr:Magnesium transport protein CorA, transmembrane region [Glarea lozoyensis ATCC 20868]EPE29854.1 Magnesium transport protein CorA, transmembrane region [Glarea lozoyensis ATCC 20868]